MIGNDIVDFKIASRSRWKETRFRKKIFTLTELNEILTSSQEAVTLWQIWSMKEAAYKAHQRNFYLKRRFNPKELSCTFLSRQNGIVQVEDKKYYTSTNISEDCVHSIATKEPSAKLLQQKYRTSVNLNYEVLKQVACAKNLPLGELKIQKDEDKIPFLFYKNRKLPTVFSLSHHGRFSAFIMEVN